MDVVLKTPLKPARVTLRMRTLILISLTLVGSLVVLYAVARMVVLDSFTDLEKQETRRSTRRVLNLLRAEADTLNATTADWAQWDDTYDFVQTGSQEYVDLNLGDKTFLDLNVNLMLFTNNQGELVYGTIYYFEEERIVSLTSGVIGRFLTESGLLLRYGNNPDPTNYVSGVVLLPQGPMLVSIQTVLTSLEEGPPMGTVVFGRFLDETKLTELAETTGLTITLRPFNDPALPDDFQAAHDVLVNTPDYTSVQFPGDGTIAGYTAVSDVSGRPSLILRVSTPRDVYERGTDAATVFGGVSLAVGLILLLVTMLLLERTVFRRLGTLSASLQNIGQRGDPGARVTVDRPDELGSVADAINGMLSALQRSQERLADERGLLRTLIDNMPDFIYVKDRAGHFLMANAASADLMGAAGPDELLGKTDHDFYPRELAERYYADERIVMETGVPLLNREEDSYHEARPEKRWILSTKMPLYDRTGGITGIIGIGRDITQRKAMEEQIRRTRDDLEQRVAERTVALAEANARLAIERNQLRTLIDAMPDYIYIKDAEDRFVNANAGVAQLMGLSSPDDAFGKTDHDFFDPDLADKFQADDLTVLRTGRHLIGIEEPSRDPHGNPIWVLTTKVPLRDLKGEIVGLVGIGRDITTRKRMEDELRRAHDELEQRVAERTAELRANQEQLERVLEGSNDGFWDWDIPTGSVDFSARWAEMLGYELGDLENHVSSWERLLHPDDAPACWQALEEHLAGRTAQYETEYRMRHKSGEWVWILDRGKVVARDADGMPLRMAGTHTDIMARKRAQEQIRFQAHLLDVVQNAVIATDAASHITYWNRHAETLYGWSSDQVVGRAASDILPAAVAEQLVDTILPNLEQGDSWSGELEIVHRNGRRFPVMLTSSPVEGEDGSFGGTVSVSADISEIKTAQQALRKANRAYRALSDCNQAMVRATDEDSLLNEICQIIVTSGGYHMAWVGFLKNDAQRSLVQMAHAGHEDGYLAQVMDTINNPDTAPGPTRTAVSSRQPYVTRNIGTDPRYAPWREAALARGYQSSVVLPLIIAGEVVGTLNVYADEIAAFEPAEVNLLVELAGDLAFGLETLRERVRRQQAEAQRRESEANLMALINNTEDWIWSANRDLRILKMNNAMLRGYAAHTGCQLGPGDPYMAHLDEDDRAAWKQMLQRALQGERFTVERHYVPTSGPELDIEISLNPIIGENSEITGVAVFSRDITARKQSEAELLSLNERLAQRNRELVVLHEVGRALTATLDPQEIYRLLYEDIARRLLGADHCFISLYDEEQQLITPVFSVIDGQETDPSTLPPMPLGSGPQSRAIQTRLPQIVDLQNVGTDKVVTVGEQDRAARSALMVPLVSGNHVTGVIKIQHNEIRAFQSPHARLLATIANQAAIAIRNAQLFTGEHQQRTLAEALRDTAAAINRTLDLDTVMDCILDNLKRILDYDAANIMLIEGNLARLVRHQGYEDLNLGSWIENVTFDITQTQGLRHVVETGQALAVPDTHAFDGWIHREEQTWLRSYACAPIISDSKVIGFLSLDSATAGCFDERDTERLQAFADQAAIAIRNAQLFAAEREQRTLAEALADNAATINNTLEPEAVLERVLVNLGYVLPHDAANIMLIDGDAARVVRASGYGERQLDDWVNGLSLSVSSNAILHQIARDGEVYISPDTAADPNWDNLPETGWQHCYAGAPIRREGKVIGFLNVYSTAPGFFSTAHSPRLQHFADQAGVAIRNAQLFAAERDQRSLAEALSDAAAAVTSTLDPDMVMDRILDRLDAVVPHDSASIMLIEGDTARIVRHRGFVERGTGEKVDELRFATTDLKFSQMMASGEPVCLTDTHVNPNWIHYEEIDWIRSYVGAPIMHGDKMIGVLNLDSAQPNFFTEAHARRLQAFADQVAIALRNAQYFAAERDQRAMAEALRDTAAVLSSALDVDDVLDHILSMVERVLPHDAANIMLIENGVARIARGTGYEERGLENVTGWRFTMSEKPLWLHMIETRQPFAIPDVSKEPLWHNRPEDAWIRSSVKAPIFVEGQAIGILHLDSATPNTFKAQDAERLQAFADQAAVALHNARLFAAERDQRALAEALRDTAIAINQTLDPDTVMDRILTNVGQVVPHDAANIMFIENNTARIASEYGYVERDPEGWKPDIELNVTEIPTWQLMLDMHQPTVIPDTYQDPDWIARIEQDALQERWIRSTVKAPIFSDDQVIGLLHLDSATPGAFTHEDAERLQAFAAQAAVAIRNARLYEAEREQRTLAEALRDMAAAMNSTLDFDKVLGRILANVKRVVPHDLTVLAFIDDEGYTDVVGSRGYTERGLEDWIANLHMRVADVPPLRYAAEHREPVITYDTQHNPDWIVFPETAWIRSHVAVPIVSDGDVRGFLLLDSVEPNHFSTEHLDPLRAFADQAAIAIRNAQLYQATQSYAAEMEQRVRERTAELEAQHAQLQIVLDSMGEGVMYSVGPDLIYVNQALSDLIGYSTDELLATPLDIYTSITKSAAERERIQTEAIQAFKRGESLRTEARLTRKDGTEFDAALTANLVPQSDGGTVTLFRDISQEKALQEQKDRFIANASHELRTPLANFKTRLYLIRRQPQHIEPHLDVLERVSDIMTALIENLLDVSRFERGVIPLHRQRCALQPLITDVMSIQRVEAENKQILLEADLPDDPLHAFVDVQRITQVVTNLLTNAINYTPDGGTVTVRLREEEDGGTRSAVLEVRDTGIGIAQDQIPHVFDPFFRANEGIAGGTGLGLTIAREIIHLHNGSITVDSEIDRGSVFTIRLAVVDE